MSNNHWFFDCPRTQITWKSIWQHVFNYPVISFTPLKTHVYTLQPMNYVSAKRPLLSSLDITQVVGYTLRGLWSAHWKWTFQKQKQSPSSILRSLINLVKDKDLDLD